MKKLITTAIIIAVAGTLFGCAKDSIDNSSPTASPDSSNVAATATVDKKKGALTKTGLYALSPVHYAVGDKYNKAGLSEKGVGYGYGVAKDGKPHEISVNNQKFFEPFSAFCLDTKSKEKTLYLTFDCGYENGYTAPILDILKDKKVPAAFFVTKDYLESEAGDEMTVRMIKEGHIIGNHSASHPTFPRISREKMTREIEECENYLRKNYGYTSKFFRFPTGEYSECSLELVQSLGLKSAFWSLAYLDYEVNAQPAPEDAFKTLTSRLHPGAVILIHSVSKTNAEILDDVIDYARNQGYVFKSLDEFPVK